MRRVLRIYNGFRGNHTVYEGFKGGTEAITKNMKAIEEGRLCKGPRGFYRGDWRLLKAV